MREPLLACIYLVQPPSDCMCEQSMSTQAYVFACPPLRVAVCSDSAVGADVVPAASITTRSSASTRPS
eukprot:6180789-Pleurochrysis_carterae.AAC.1